jgi:hypothetical protein
MTLAVAIYAAVVASLALAWTVYQWQHDRKGELTLDLMASYTDGELHVQSTVFNANDYPVTVVTFYLRVVGRWAPRFFLNFRPHRGWRRGFGIWLSPKQVGIPAVIPAHDSVVFRWDTGAGGPYGSRGFSNPGDLVALTVQNSLGRSGTAVSRSYVEAIDQDEPC